MKKNFIILSIAVLLVTVIGAVLANNKAKIDKAATPPTVKTVIPVKTWAVRTDSFSTAFIINGTTSPVREVTIASEVQGKLENLLVKNGDQVRAGQVIATLDASVLGAQLRSTGYSIEKAELDLRRYHKLISLGGATPLQLESVKLQYESLLAQRKEILQQIDHMQIRAPFSGVLENLLVEKGAFVSYGSKLADLIDNSSLKIKVYLSEQEAMRVKLSQPVTVHSVVLSAPKTGSITMLSDKADASGKFLAEISVPNAGREKLKSGMLTDVSFSAEEIQTGLAVPVAAISGSMKDARVYVVKNGKAQHRAITTGLVTPTRVQVLGGLEEGEEVVVSGQMNLEDGTPVSIIK